MPWAASPASAKRGAMKSRASVRPSGKACRPPTTFSAAELVAEAALQLFLEDEVVAGDQPFRILRPLRPDQRGAVVLQGQRRKGPGRQEMLLRRAVMRALVLDGGDDAGLAIVEIHRLDAGGIAQLRAHAVAGDQQPRLEHVAARQRDGDRMIAALEILR